MNLDDQFDAVIRAVANQSRRPRVMTAAERIAAEKERRKSDPKHIAAVKNRRKAKRGGPR